MQPERTMADSPGNRRTTGGVDMEPERDALGAPGAGERQVPISSGALDDGPPSSPAVGGGLSLDTLLDGRTLLPIPSVVRILGDMAVQIDDLHMRGIAYDALSPAAIEVTLDEHAQLLPIDDAPRPGPGYVAPERRHGFVTTQGDQYALGIIAWELFTGRRRETRLDGTSIAVVTELEIGPARVLRPGVGPGVNAAIERATNASIEARYQSAGAFVADVAAALDPNAPKPALLQPARQFDEPAFNAAAHRRAPGTGMGRVFGLSVAAVMIVVALGTTTWLGSRSSGKFLSTSADAPDRGGLNWFGYKPRPAAGPAQPATGSAAAATGVVSVTVDGATAEVLIDGSVAGRSPALVRAAPGSHTIQVRSGTQRFEPAAVTVRISGSDTVSAAFRRTP